METSFWSLRWIWTCLASTTVMIPSIRSFFSISSNKGGPYHSCEHQLPACSMTPLLYPFDRRNSLRTWHCKESLNNRSWICQTCGLQHDIVKFIRFLRISKRRSEIVRVRTVNSSPKVLMRSPLTLQQIHPLLSWKICKWAVGLCLA